MRPYPARTRICEVQSRSTLAVDNSAKRRDPRPGSFSRAFHVEMGQSPTKVVENLRVEAARRPSRQPTMFLVAA
jgi:transcriptional regulator GlxA family with amidase domain